MSHTRRRFLHAAAGTAAVAPSLLGAGASGAADKVVMGVIGPGGMGTTLLRSFANIEDTTIAYVCDCDAERCARARDEVKKTAGNTPAAVKDMRAIFDDKAVEAVIIATPDHWHAPATLLALEAGKHVYVEKPCAHNIREGRLMVEAARRAGRIVQVGTQSRSSENLIKAMRLLREGGVSQDGAPTILDLCGIATPGGMQGRSLRPLLWGEPVEWRSDFFCESLILLQDYPVIQGVRSLDWKYIRYWPNRNAPEDYRGLLNLGLNGESPAYEELFHLAADPLEQSNLASDPTHAAVLAGLSRALTAYRASSPTP